MSDKTTIIIKGVRYIPEKTEKKIEKKTLQLQTILDTLISINKFECDGINCNDCAFNTKDDCVSSLVIDMLERAAGYPNE